MKRRKFILQSSGLLATAGLSSAFMSAEEKPLQSPVIKILSPSLKKGDLIGVTGPAGSIWNKWHITKIEEKLTSLGFKVLLGETLQKQEGYLAGTDQMRAEELMGMYQNKEIKAILTMRGGWGCARILDLLDYTIIRENPKVLIGFSDITSLVNAVHKMTGHVTFHGPCGYSSWEDFTTNEVTKAIVDGSPYTMKNPDDYTENLRTLSSGKSSGQLVGGNLTVIVSMIGTKYEPLWKSKLLFLEETTEEPYRIDRMLWQLKQVGVFEQINGLVLGSFHNCDPEEPEKSFSLIEVLEQHFLNAPFPVYMGASFGHLKHKFTLPLGIECELNADLQQITTLERSVLV